MARDMPIRPPPIQTSERDITDDEATGLVVVWFLAVLTAAVDVCGVSLLKDLFVSFMSGNTTSLGMAIAKADWARAALIAGIIAAFVGGAAAGTIVATLAGRRHLTVTILLVGAILVIPVAAPTGAIAAMTFAMGALNAAMQHAGPVQVSVTYVTGTLVKLGRGLGHLLCGELKDWAWLEQAVPWTGLLAGAAGMSLLVARYGEGTFAALPIASALLALATAAISLRARRQGSHVGCVPAGPRGPGAP